MILNGLGSPLGVACSGLQRPRGSDIAQRDPRRGLVFHVEHDCRGPTLPRARGLALEHLPDHRPSASMAFMITPRAQPPIADAECRFRVPPTLRRCTRCSTWNVWHSTREVMRASGMLAGGRTIRARQSPPSGVGLRDPGSEAAHAIPAGAGSQRPGVLSGRRRTAGLVRGRSLASLAAIRGSSSAASGVPRVDVFGASRSRLKAPQPNSGSP